MTYIKKLLESRPVNSASMEDIEKESIDAADTKIKFVIDYIKKFSEIQYGDGECIKEFYDYEDYFDEGGCVSELRWHPDWPYRVLVGFEDEDGDTTAIEPRDFLDMPKSFRDEVVNIAMKSESWSVIKELNEGNDPTHGTSVEDLENDAIDATNSFEYYNNIYLSILNKMQPDRIDDVDVESKTYMNVWGAVYQDWNEPEKCIFTIDEEIPCDIEYYPEDNYINVQFAEICNHDEDDTGELYIDNGGYASLDSWYEHDKESFLKAFNYFYKTNAHFLNEGNDPTHGTSVEDLEKDATMERELKWQAFLNKIKHEDLYFELVDTEEGEDSYGQEQEFVNPETAIFLHFDAQEHLCSSDYNQIDKDVLIQSIDFRKYIGVDIYSYDTEEDTGFFIMREWDGFIKLEDIKDIDPKTYEQIKEYCFSHYIDERINESSDKGGTSVEDIETDAVDIATSKEMRMARKQYLFKGDDWEITDETRDNWKYMFIEEHEEEIRNNIIEELQDCSDDWDNDEMNEFAPNFNSQKLETYIQNYKEEYVDSAMYSELKEYMFQQEEFEDEYVCGIYRNVAEKLEDQIKFHNTKCLGDLQANFYRYNSPSFISIKGKYNPTYIQFPDVFSDFEDCMSDGYGDDRGSVYDQEIYLQDGGIHVNYGHVYYLLSPKGEEHVSYDGSNSYLDDEIAPDSLIDNRDYSPEKYIKWLRENEYIVDLYDLNIDPFLCESSKPGGSSMEDLESDADSSCTSLKCFDLLTKHADLGFINELYNKAMSLNLEPEDLELYMQWNVKVHEIEEQLLSEDPDLPIDWRDETDICNSEDYIERPEYFLPYIHLVQKGEKDWHWADAYQNYPDANAAYYADASVVFENGKINL